MGDKFSWERLLKRNKEEEQNDNTIDLVPDTPPMGPVAPLKASKPAAPKASLPPVISSEPDKPRPPLVIDWDEYQQTEQPSHSPAEMPRSEPIQANLPPVEPQAPVMVTSAPPVASPIEVPSATPQGPESTPDTPAFTPIAPPSESVASAPVVPEPSQFWERLGENTTQALSNPVGPAVAGWDDVELTPRERSSSMRVSSDQLAGTVEPENFAPISAEEKIEQTIQSISQSSAWDEPEHPYAPPVSTPPDEVTSTESVAAKAHRPIEPPSGTAGFTVHGGEPAGQLAPIEFNSMPTPPVEYPTPEPPASSTPFMPPAEVPVTCAESAPVVAAAPPVASTPESPTWEEAETFTPIMPPIAPEPEVPASNGGFWESILGPEASANISATPPPPVSTAPEMIEEAPVEAPSFFEKTHSTESPTTAPAPAIAPDACTPADSMFELPTDEATLQEARDIRLGEVLVNHRLVTQAQIDRAVDRQRETGQKLGEVLVGLGMVSERRLLQVLAAQKGVSPWHLEEDAPSTDALCTVPYELCKEHQVLPVAVRGELLLLAMRDTQDLAAVEVIRSYTGRRVEPVLAEASLLAAQIERSHGLMPEATLRDPEVEAFDNAPIAPVAPADMVVESPQIEQETSAVATPFQELPKLESMDAAMDWLAEPLPPEQIVAMPEEVGFHQTPREPEVETTDSAPEWDESAPVENNFAPPIAEDPHYESQVDESLEAHSDVEFASADASYGSAFEASPQENNEFAEFDASIEQPEYPSEESFESDGAECEDSWQEPEGHCPICDEPNPVAENPSLDPIEFHPTVTPEKAFSPSNEEPEFSPIPLVTEVAPPPVLEPETVAAHQEPAGNEGTDTLDSFEVEELDEVAYSLSEESLPEESLPEPSEDWLAEPEPSTSDSFKFEAAESEELAESYSYEAPVQEEESEPVVQTAESEGQPDAEPLVEQEEPAAFRQETSPVAPEAEFDLDQLFQKAASLNARALFVEIGAESAELSYQFARSNGPREPLTTDHLESLMAALTERIGFDARSMDTGAVATISVKIDDFCFNAHLTALTTSLGTRIKISFPRLNLAVRGIRDLHIEPENAKLVESLLHQPYGLLLIAGPAASGKTTTLYAIAAELQRCGCTVVTCESPVEAQLPGVHQIDAAGRDLDSLVDAVLRQGADRVFIGEITDAASAQLVIDAALAGCAVVATLRSLDSADAIETLLDWGIAPHRLARALNGVLAQRLIRTLGDGSYKSDEITTAEAEALKQYFGNPQIRELPRAAATESWDGFSGETAIHEVFVNSEETAALIACQKPMEEVMDIAGYYGYLPLRFDGLRRVTTGETTFDELRRTVALRPLRKSEPRSLAG